jgi:DNA-binding NarL/FixJ family response regulator
MRVVIAEDSVLLREGLTRLLTEAGFEVLAAAGDGVELLEAVERHRPDLVVTDVRMPPDFQAEGTRAAVEIRRTWPGTGIVILAQHVEARFAVDLLRDHPGAVGYLLKERVSDLGSFVDALRTVGSGGTVIDAEVVAALLGAPRHQVEGDLATLSPREVDVLGLIAEGHSNQSIAARLVVTTRTVETHVASIFAKLRLPESPDGHRRVLAVLTYLRGRDAVSGV